MIYQHNGQTIKARDLKFGGFILYFTRIKNKCINSCVYYVIQRKITLSAS